MAHDTVGAFEYVVLSGGTVEGVVQFLDDNGYAQDPEAMEAFKKVSRSAWRRSAPGIPASA